jgi:hypothetical protein
MRYRLRTKQRARYTPMLTSIPGLLVLTGEPGSSVARHGLPLEGRTIPGDQRLALSRGAALPADVAAQPKPAHSARPGQSGRIARIPEALCVERGRMPRLSVPSAMDSSAVGLTMAPRSAANPMATIYVASGYASPLLGPTLPR